MYYIAAPLFGNVLERDIGVKTARLRFSYDLAADGWVGVNNMILNKRY